METGALSSGFGKARKLPVLNLVQFPDSGDAKGVLMEQRIGESFYEELERRRAAEPPIFPRMIALRENPAEDGLRPEDYELEQRR